MRVPISRFEGQRHSWLSGEDPQLHRWRYASIVGVRQEAGKYAGSFTVAVEYQ